jgi:hypothetical protein
MERATPKNVARARKWVEQLPLRLQTNVHDALELAFVLAGRGARDRYYPSAVDTIFFLSDGAPTRPGADNGRRMQADDPRQILSAVRRWNALGRVVVHTIALGLRPERPRRGRGRDGGGGRGAGRPGPRQFMRELAEQNHGKFVEAR